MTTAAADPQIVLREPTSLPELRAASLCIFPSAGLGKTSSAAHWRDCELCYLQPNDVADVRAFNQTSHPPAGPAPGRVAIISCRHPPR